MGKRPKSKQFLRICLGRTQYNLHMQKIATSAESYLPEIRTLAVLRQAVQQCRGCDLYHNATQAVVGEIEEKHKFTARS
jgi:hypothetical protein